MKCERMKEERCGQNLSSAMCWKHDDQTGRASASMPESHGLNPTSVSVWLLLAEQNIFCKILPLIPNTYEGICISVVIVSYHAGDDLSIAECIFKMFWS